MSDSAGRVVMDTSALVSAFLWPDSLPGRALDKAARDGLMLVSSSTLAELQEVLERDKFDKYVSLEERRSLFESFRTVGIQVSIQEAVTACRDPKDDKFLEVAVNGNATVVVTGDKDLLELHPFRGVAIVKARTFVEGRGR